MSLVDRCKHFLREFPTAKMNPTLLRQVYRLHGVKKKKYRWYKTPAAGDPNERRQQLTTMKAQLTKARNQGYKIVYADETMFTRKTVPDADWSRPKENPAVDVAKLDEPTLALLCGISKEQGLEHYQVFEQSVNKAKFAEWLRGLKAANENQKIAVFMDRLSVHTSGDSKDVMRELGIRWILN